MTKKTTESDASSEQREPGPLKFLNGLYDSRSDQVQLLYKYRPCAPHHIRSLQMDQVWFSTAAQLNDPFDCLIRLPDIPTPTDMIHLRSRLATTPAYNLRVESPLQIATHIGKSQEMTFLEPLGIEATQHGHQSLLDHIREVRRDDDWIRRLAAMARELAGAIFHNMVVFCLCERNDHPLMWAHYSQSHTGFCTGYVSPVGIDNPRLIHKVRYVSSPPAVTMFQLIEDPGGVVQDLVLTKPLEWSYEDEWRIVFGNMPGIAGDLLPYRDIILGAKILREDELAIRAAVGDRRVRFFRVNPNHSHGRYSLEINPTDEGCPTTA